MKGGLIMTEKVKNQFKNEKELIEHIQKVINGDILLNVKNGDKYTPQVPWSSNLEEYTFNLDDEYRHTGWGITQLDNGEFVLLEIFNGPPEAYIIPPEDAFEIISGSEQYHLIDFFHLQGKQRKCEYGKVGLI